MVKKQISASYQSFMKRISALFLVVIAGTLLTGCITFLTEIKVRGDGSGTMVQTMTINPEQMKESMEGIAKQMGAPTTGSKADAKKDSSKASEEDPFKEGDLKGKAADLGPGVTFVSAEKIDTKTAVGVRVTYAFKDINQLAVNPKPAAAMGTAGAGASSQDALKFRFNRKPDGNAVLTVVLARPKPEAANEQAAKRPRSRHRYSRLSGGIGSADGHDEADVQRSPHGHGRRCGGQGRQDEQPVCRRIEGHADGHRLSTRFCPTRRASRP